MGGTCCKRGVIVSEEKKELLLTSPQQQNIVQQEIRNELGYEKIFDNEFHKVSEVPSMDTHITMEDESTSPNFTQSNSKEQSSRNFIETVSESDTNGHGNDTSNDAPASKPRNMNENEIKEFHAADKKFAEFQRRKSLEEENEEEEKKEESKEDELKRKIPLILKRKSILAEKDIAKLNSYLYMIQQRKGTVIEKIKIQSMGKIGFPVLELLDVDSSWSIMKLKNLIKAKTPDKISVSLQRLIYKGHLLKDTKSIETYKIQSDDTIMLVRSSGKSRSPSVMNLVNTNKETIRDRGMTTGAFFRTASPEPIS